MNEKLKKIVKHRISIYGDNNKYDLGMSQKEFNKLFESIKNDIKDLDINEIDEYLSTKNIIDLDQQYGDSKL